MFTCMVENHLFIIEPFSLLIRSFLNASESLHSQIEEIYLIAIFFFYAHSKLFNKCKFSHASFFTLLGFLIFLRTFIDNFHDHQEAFIYLTEKYRKTRLPSFFFEWNVVKWKAIARFMLQKTIWIFRLPAQKFALIQYDSEYNIIFVNF